MDKEMSRRDMLKLGSLAGASVIGGGLVGYAAATPQFQATNGMWPWPLTKKINLTRAAKIAYENYYVKGCMYATFTGVVKRVGDALGSPYSDFPYEMMHFGAGGGELWGSLCGTLNGGLAALAIFVSDTTLRRSMASQLMKWYESTRLPTWNPTVPLKAVPVKLPKSKAESPLCHVSIGRWVTRSGYDPFSPERADRCGRVAASVAEFTARLLNEALIKGVLTDRKEISKAADDCLGCHGRGPAGLNEPDILSKMNCTPCHDTEVDRSIFPHPQE
jgi:hypothetical protein